MRSTLRPARAFAFVLLSLFLAGPALAEEAPRSDRFAGVFDRADDPGKLVVRFLRMSLVTEADDKSGDASVVTSPDGKVMLVDAGAPECADQVIACLDAMGVTRIDAVLVSHPHVDHVGGLPRVFERFEVGTLYMSRVEYPTKAYRDAVAAVGREGCELVYLEEGSSFEFGGQVKAEVFNPEPGIAYYEGYPANSTQFVNNKSLVVRLSYGMSSILLMGDVYTPREAELVAKYGDRLRSDVVKIGHHGSDTSSSKSFARAVAPKLAVAMHDQLASLQVYKNWRKVGAQVFVTALDGSVRVAGDDQGNWSALSQFDRASDFLN